MQEKYLIHSYTNKTNLFLLSSRRMSSSLSRSEIHGVPMAAGTDSSQTILKNGINTDIFVKSCKWRSSPRSRKELGGCLSSIFVNTSTKYTSVESSLITGKDTHWKLNGRERPQEEVQQMQYNFLTPIIAWNVIPRREDLDNFKNIQMDSDDKWFNNPQFRLKITKNTKLFITLMQEDQKLTNKSYVPVNLMIARTKDPQNRLWERPTEEDIVLETMKSIQRYMNSVRESL